MSGPDSGHIQSHGRAPHSGDLELTDWSWPSTSQYAPAQRDWAAKNASTSTRAAPTQGAVSASSTTSSARDEAAMSQNPLVREGSEASHQSYSSVTPDHHSRSSTQRSRDDGDRPQSGARSTASQSVASRSHRQRRSSVLHSIASGVELAAPQGRIPQAIGPSERPTRANEDRAEEDSETSDREDHGPPDNSLYPEVRASVPATDNTSLSISTPRMWTLSIIFALLGSASNLFFSLRYPSVTITPVVALILVHPIGHIWDLVFKRAEDPDDYFEDGYRSSKNLSGSLSRRLRLWLGQGRWNEKEHACVYVSSNVSFGFAFATDVIVEQHKFYHQDVPILYQLLLTISTQIIGYAFAGMARRFLVRPPSMIWPGTLMSTAMFSTMHKRENRVANGWRVSRWRFFIYVWSGAMLWYFVPGLLMPALSYFNVLTWFAPDNVVLANLFGVSSGLGMFPLTFDWSQLAYIGSPLLTPWWAAVNVFSGLAIVMWVIAPILYYRNALFSAFMPIVSSSIFDNTGRIYDVQKILTPDFTFDEQKYRQYSPIYIPVTYMLSYAVQFASLTALITHTVCWYGKDIWMQTRDSFSSQKEKLEGSGYEPLRPSSPADGANGSRPRDGLAPEETENTRTSLRGRDVHNRLMERYEDVSIFWYVSTLVCMLAIAIFVVEHYPIHLPWYGLLLALGITTVMFIPIAIVMAITNQHSSLYLVGQLIAGYVFPGRPVANMVFTTYLYISSFQGVKFSSDLKLGHYMKIPPKILFSVQVVTTSISSVTQVGVLNWMFVNIEGICTPEAINGFNCPLARVHFNGSVLWGVVGPYRFFASDGLYHRMVWAFGIGIVAPPLVWLVARRFKKRWMWKINLPLVFGSLSWIPPAVGFRDTSTNLAFANSFSDGPQLLGLDPDLLHFQLHDPPPGVRLVGQVYDDLVCGA